MLCKLFGLSYCLIGLKGLLVGRRIGPLVDCCLVFGMSYSMMYGMLFGTSFGMIRCSVCCWICCFIHGSVWCWIVPCWGIRRWCVVWYVVGCLVQVVFRWNRVSLFVQAVFRWNSEVGVTFHTQEKPENRTQMTNWMMISKKVKKFNKILFQALTHFLPLFLPLLVPSTHAVSNIYIYLCREEYDHSELKYDTMARQLILMTPCPWCKILI